MAIKKEDMNLLIFAERPGLEKEQKGGTNGTSLHIECKLLFSRAWEQLCLDNLLGFVSACLGRK